MFNIYVNVNVGNSSESIGENEDALKVRDELAKGEPAGAPAELEIVLENDGEVYYDKDGNSVTFRIKI